MLSQTIENILYSSEKSLLQIETIHEYLSCESYWANSIPLETVKASIDGSVCFGAYYNGRQVAFARLITDHATFGYLADVFVIEEFRGKGISKNLMSFIMSDPAVLKFRRFMLATKDAHGLYEKFGFKSVQSPERLMERKGLENYQAE
jgi:GNAT superfamily N-acetyltransferase